MWSQSRMWSEVSEVSTRMIVACLLAMLVGRAAGASPEQCLIVTLSNVPLQDESASTGGVKGTQSNYVTVDVSQGSLRGKRVISEKTGKEYFSFQGIPYAQPPVGELRFQAPREASSWTGVRDATSLGAICPQFDNGPIRGSEDCLFLNVYTPQRPGASNSKLLPVMVWIHGGSYTYGSGNDVNYGPDFLISKNVILVTLNYRLGVLGFLGLSNSLISQNNGLKDQMAALKWVQANIAQFGGDKKKVTIFGQSSGSSCVELQVLSPATKGLFQRAISQSGNAINVWATDEPSSARRRAFLLGQLLGQTTDNEDELINFFKTAPVEQLITSQGSALTEEDIIRGVIPFKPVIEEAAPRSTGVFLPDSPLNILKSGKYQQVPFLTGFNSAEAKFVFTGFLTNETLWQLSNSNMERFVPPELGLPLRSPKSQELGAEIKQLYFGDVTPSVKDIRAFVDLATDSYYIEGTRRDVLNFRTRTSSAPVYAYQFSYVGSLSISEFCNFGYPFRGAAHVDELGYLFWIHRIDSKINSTDAAMRDRMTTMWTNFAKTGNPNGHLNVRWDPVTRTRQKYLDIDTHLRMCDFSNLRPDKFAFWDKLYESVDN